MTIYYVVPVPSSSTSVSGGTRKLFDHVAILNAHGIAAELLHHLPPGKIESGPENLFVFPEVYGEHLIDALPPGVPRISMVQNGYLLDYDAMAAPKSPHPFMRCRDLVAVMVESQHTEDIVRARFPDLACPIIRFTSSGNGRDGRGTGLHYGAWPRTKTVTYFEYKRQELNHSVFEGIELPPGWALAPIANMTDEQVAETLRTSAIFAAPLTHEGLCATTQEALIAGAAIVAWPGGPSQFVPTGWPTTSTPIAQTEGNTTVGGPMEYLAGRAQIAPQDDLEALRQLIVETARSIEADYAPWAEHTAEWSRWHTEEAYSREREVIELIDIMRSLTARHAGLGSTRPIAPDDLAAVYQAGPKASALADAGRAGEAADLLLAAVRGANGRVDHLALLLECLEQAGRDPAEVCAAIPAEAVTHFVPQLLEIGAPHADRILDTLHAADSASIPLIAVAAEVAPHLPVSRRLVWSARLRTLGLGSSCPALRAAAQPGEAPIERVVGAAATWATFADPRARQVFAAGVLELCEREREGLDAVLQGIAPDLAPLVELLPAPAPRGSAPAPAPGAPSASVVVVSRTVANIRATALTAELARAGQRAVVLQPGTAHPAQAPSGVTVRGFGEGGEWPKNCLGHFVRTHGAPHPDVVVVPSEAARALVPALRALLPETLLIVDADAGAPLGFGADHVLSFTGAPGADAAGASAHSYLGGRSPVPLAARAGVCIVGDTRDASQAEREALAALVGPLGAAATDTSVVVLGDDPERLLDGPGWLRVGALVDPTPWIAAARVVLVARSRGAQHWLEAAALCATPALVVPDDPAAAAQIPPAVVALASDDALFASFSPPLPQFLDADSDDKLVARCAAAASEAPTDPESVRILVEAEELLGNGALLASYDAGLDGAEGAALVVYGPGMDPARFEAELRSLAASVGFDLEDGPQVMAVLPPTRRAEDEAEIAARMTGLLTRRAPRGAFAGLPVLDGTDPAALRRLGAAASQPSAAPLVSVLLPIYNHGRFLAESIESVLAQTCGDFELILVDDRSSDDAPAIAERLARRDRRVTFVQNERNLGLVENHRRCLSMATGQFVKFLHGDDRLRPNALERLVVEAVLHPEAPLVTSTRTVIDGEGRPQPPALWTVPLAERDTLFVGTAVGDHLLSTGLNRVGEPSTPLFRRGAITPEQFSAYAGRTYTSLLDISTWITLLARGPLAYIAEPLSELRLHNGQYGHELGEVIQHVEWLALIADAHKAGFLSGEASFATAVGTMSVRLVSAYVAAPCGAAEEIGDAIGSALGQISRAATRATAAAA